MYDSKGDCLRDGARAVAVGLLDAAGGGRRLASRLGGELLAGRLAAGGLASCLLGAGHDVFLMGGTMLCYGIEFRIGVFSFFFGFLERAFSRQSTRRIYFGNGKGRIKRFDWRNEIPSKFLENVHVIFGRATIV